MNNKWQSSLTLALAALALSASQALAQQDYTPSKIVQMVKDSVVSIDANAVTFGAVYSGGFGGVEMGRQSRVLTNRITGFVYSPKGYIITNGNQVDKNSIITVTLDDQTELTATLVDRDEDYGIAVLKVDSPKPLKAVKIARELYDPEQGVYPYAQGDQVVAVGNSGGYGQTVTAGIISAVRNLRNSAGILIPNMIQADCVINPGNDGCALFNAEGVVVGMHERQGGGGGLQRITFFAPMWLVCRVADEMIANYEKEVPERDFKVWRPWLGIKPFAGSAGAFGGVRQVGDDLKMYMDWPEQYWDVGIWIDTVWPDSPAAEFGIKGKDVLYSLTITRVDRLGEEREIQPYQYLKTVEQLERLVSTAQEGDRFIFGVYRNGRVRDVEVVIAQHPGAFSTVRLTSAMSFEQSREYF